MITVRTQRCQTLRWGLVTACCIVAAGRLFAGPTPSPTPPAWQQEITAAHLLEASLVLAPAKTASEQAARHRQLQDLYRGLAQKYSHEIAVQKAAGDYFTRDGQPDAAFPYWEKAVQLDPCDGEADDRLGGAYLGLGRTRSAYEHFQKAVDAQPDVAAYHFDLANVVYMFRRDLLSPPIPGLGDDQSALTVALTHFRRAAELAPGDLRLARAYAETFYVFAEPVWAQALAAWETVRTLSGDQTDFPNSHLARISLRLGKPQAATEYLGRMHDPTFNGLKAQLLKQAYRLRTSPPRP